MYISCIYVDIYIYIHVHVYIYVYIYIHICTSTPPDWCFIAEPSAPAPHLAHPEGYTALRIVLATVPQSASTPPLKPTL